MSPTLAAFEALGSFDRPATRRELQRAAGLEKAAIDAGLRVLARAGILIALVDRRRCRGLYRLAPGSACPPGRGKYVRRAA